jgi:5-methylcytosine-specific restriction endonuclease McrA
LIQARRGVYEHWKRALARIRREHGGLPRWVAMVLLLAAATEQWQTTHDAFLPTEYRILERDGYRCRAPGCTARKSLEVHHIIFRSHNGPDASWNLTTLCAAHHRHAVHEGTLRVWGRAPHDLTWQVGSPDGGATWIYRGDRSVVFAWRPAGAEAA